MICVLCTCKVWDSWKSFLFSLFSGVDIAMTEIYILTVMQSALALLFPYTETEI